MHRLPAYILAGGKSRRFGSDKARALIGGRSLIRRLADQLTPITASIVAVADVADKYADLGISTIADQRPGAGPLGGLETALHDLAHSSSADRLLLVACDMLEMRAAWIEKLLEDELSPAVAFHTDRWEPFPGVYSRTLAQQVKMRLDHHQLAMQSFLDDVGATAIDLPADWPTLLQVNTQQEHRRAELQDGMHNDPAGRMNVVEADITTLHVDAIVNAANTTLLGGGGVDGAIHRAAGPKLLEECRALGGCNTGDAKITGGYNLPARHIIHTVGPVYRDGRHGEDDALASCYRRSLEVAGEHAIKTVAFPAISTGVYCFPPDRAARIAVDTVRAFLRTDSSIEKVAFVCFDRGTRQLYERLLG